MKLKNREKIYILVLILVPLSIFIFHFINGQISGSQVDWISQHTSFPDYFRKLFYQTHSLFLEFAPNLGGGQNIYNFAYYGLFNPLYLLSYLFPFIDMITYIQLISLLEEISVGLLCYYWLQSHFEKQWAFVGALLVTGNSAIIYHFETQLMFVNYLPFLFLALIASDHYQHKNTYVLLVFSLVGTILTSFYFSIGVFIVVFIYQIAINQLFSLKQLLKHGWHFTYPMIISIILSLFYLLPVYMAMKAGRNSIVSFDLASLLTLRFNPNDLLYSSYGLGFTYISLLALSMGVLSKQKEIRLLASIMIIFLVVPLLMFLLNGGLYVRAKALLPFIPIVVYIFVDFIIKISNQKTSLKKIILGIGLSLIMIIPSLIKNLSIVLCLDILLSIIALCWLFKNKINLFKICVMLMISVSTLNQVKDLDNKLVSRNYQRPEIENGLKQTRITYGDDVQVSNYDVNTLSANNESIISCYSSVSNKYYTRFRKNYGLAKPSRNRLSNDIVNNELFLRFMGVSKIYTKTAVKDLDNASPLFYLSDQLISKETYDKLNWSEKQIALLEHTVIEEDSDQLPKESVTTLKTISSKTVYDHTAKEKITKTYPIENNGSQYLFIDFTVKNYRKNKDVVIDINNQRNKLSALTSTNYNDNTIFHYTLPLDDGTNNIKIILSSGHYQISKVNYALGRVNTTPDNHLYNHPIKLKELPSFSGFQGEVETTGGILVSTIPYDPSFQAFINDKELATINVNDGFLAVRLPKGKYHLKITYRASGSALGKILSVLGLIILGVDLIRKNLFKNKSESNGHTNKKGVGRND